jgi:hypothetical protein
VTKLIHLLQSPKPKVSSGDACLLYKSRRQRFAILRKHSVPTDKRPQRPQRRNAQGFLSVLCELRVQTLHFSEALLGFAGHPRVVALAVDGRHLRAHRTQIHRKLTAVVDRMIQPELDVDDRRKLEKD